MARYSWIFAVSSWIVALTLASPQPPFRLLYSLILGAGVGVKPSMHCKELPPPPPPPPMYKHFKHHDRFDWLINVKTSFNIKHPSNWGVLYRYKIQPHWMFECHLLAVICY